MEKYNTGFTTNCRGCEALQSGGTQAAHNDDCRKRVIEKISETDDERASEIWERLSAWSKHMEQQRAPAQRPASSQDAGVQPQGPKDARRPEDEPDAQPSKEARSEADLPQPSEPRAYPAGASPVGQGEKRKAEDLPDDPRLEDTGAGPSTSITPVPLDVEDLMEPPAPDAMLSSLELGVDEDVSMSPTKAKLLEAALHSVEQAFRQEEELRIRCAVHNQRHRPLIVAIVKPDVNLAAARASHATAVPRA